MAISLPPGVSIGAGRENSQTTSSGQVEQGMVFPVSTPAGSNTSVFIPYSHIHDEAWVAGRIAQQADAVRAIAG